MRKIMKVDTFNVSKIENYEEDFISYLDVNKMSLRAYQVGIKNFIDYLKDNNIKNPTRNDIIGFRNYLRKTYTSSTINMYMASIRALFKYLSIYKKYDDITIGIKGAKYNTIPKKQVLTEEQASEIYKKLENKREKALYGLLISTGIRVHEAINIDLEDIREHNGEVVIFLLRKGHEEKDSYVKISQHVLNDIREYVGERTHGKLFISKSNHNKNGGVTTKTLRLEIKNIFRRFGINEDTFSCHSLRRTFACIGYNNGASIYDIQNVLGHANIQTTTRYLKQVERDNNKTELKVSNLILGE